VQSARKIRVAGREMGLFRKMRYWDKEILKYLTLPHFIAAVERRALARELMRRRKDDTWNLTRWRKSRMFAKLRGEVHKRRSGKSSYLRPVTSQCVATNLGIAVDLAEISGARKVSPKPGL